MPTQPTIEEVQSALTNPNQATLAQAYPSYQTPQAGSAISINQLEPASPIVVPPSPPQADPLVSTAAGAQATSKALDQTIKDFQPETETRTKYDEIAASLDSLLPGLTGRGAEQLQAEADVGIPALKKALAALNSQILTKVAEAEKANAAFEEELARIETQPGMLTSISVGQQGAVRKLQLAEANRRSSDINLLQARALGLQGEVQSAQEYINRAIDLKYQDRESEVNLKMQQLSLLEGRLNKEEEAQKLLLEREYNEEQAKIAEEKAKAKENINLAFSGNVQTQFVNKNGEFFDARTGQEFARPEDFFKAAGVSSFDQAYQRGLVTDITPERIADIDFVSQLRAKYPDAGITINDSPTTANQKLQSSRIYREQVRPPASAGGGSTGVLGLSNQQIDNISPLVTQFQNSEIVKTYNTIGEQINAVKSAGNSPTDDIQRVYAFARVMDPTSVVREGEYKTIQDYSQALLQKYGLQAKRVFTNTGFLTNEARGFLLNTLENRFKASETGYKNLFNETSRRVNLIGNTDKGTQLLNNYGGAFVQTSSSPVAGPTQNVKLLYTPQVVSELREKAKAKGYTDSDLQELVDYGYTPDQVRSLLK